MIDTNLINELLNKVFHFYPIGIDHFKKNYKGFLEIKSIVEKKLESEINNENAQCNLLLNDIEIIFSDTSVLNHFHYQFPNLEIEIVMDSFQENFTKHRCHLVLIISLLTNHYTLFFEDTFLFSSLINYSSEFDPPFKIIQSFYRHKYFEKISFSAINLSITKFFPNHKYVHHYPLKNIEIEGGCPFGEDYTNGDKYTLFDFLFSYRGKAPFHSNDIIE